MNPISFWLLLACAAASTFAATAASAESPEILINKNFEAGAIGRVEKLGPDQLRLHVEGQSDEHGRNRQANWYYFQLSGVQGRQISLTLTDFVGEYDGRPGAVPMTADTIPVYSYDNVSWRHFPAMRWDNEHKEATLNFTPDQDRIWIAHVPPYPLTRLLRLLEELEARPHLRTEVIGKTAQGRDLYLITVSDFATPDQDKRTVWFIARQHAWETGSSFAMEGALRFIASDDPKAQALRRRVTFNLVPMMDPDGCASGKVRFNANGYDLNRHWDEVDLRSKELLQRMPEIWSVKKSIYAYLDSGRTIEMLLNLHNDETGESLATLMEEGSGRGLTRRFFQLLRSQSSFDPSVEPQFQTGTDHTTNALYRERKVPVITMEQKIGFSRKLARQATAEDRLAFGAQLIQCMAGAVLQPEGGGP